MWPNDSIISEENNAVLKKTAAIMKKAMKWKNNDNIDAIGGVMKGKRAANEE